MSPQTENIMKEAPQLPREARALIAEKLLESLDLNEPFELTGCVTMELADGCMLGVGVYAGGGVRKGVLDGLSTG